MSKRAQEMRKVLQEIAKADPITYNGDGWPGGDEYSCIYCFAGSDYRGNAQHKSTCPWLRAKKLAGNKE